MLRKKIKVDKTNALHFNKTFTKKIFPENDFPRLNTKKCRGMKVTLFLKHSK